MKKLIFILLTLVSTIAFGQIDETNNIVRNNTLSPARVANALDITKSFTATGTNTYAITVAYGTYSPYAGSNTYVVGDTWKITVGNVNTSTTCSLNVNGDGAIPLKDAEGNDLAIGALKAGGTYSFVYNGTHFRLTGGSGGGTWGTITGTLSSQTDLNTALGLKADQTSISNIDNTSDLDKPVSTATQAAIDGRTQRYAFACSDLTTALTTGTTKGYITLPHNFTITGVYATLLTAQTSGTILTIDIKKNGVSILSTPLTIDLNENTSSTAATPAVISTSAYTANDLLTAGFTAVGTGGLGSIVWVEGHE